MAAHVIYIDTDRSRIVTSQLDSSEKVLPRHVFGGVIPYEIILLRNFTPGAEYEIVPVIGLTVTASLGPRGSGDHLSDQPVWTPSEDLANPYWSASFPLNTPAIEAALGDEDYIESVCEVVVHDPDPRYVLQETVKIWAPVAAPGDLVVPAGMTPATIEVGDNRWFKKAGDSELILVDQTTGDKLRLWFADGELKQEIISA
jgi:hypothetical protein